MEKHRFTRCYRCDRTSKLFRCKYCGNYYCNQCSNPKIPLTPSIVFNEKDRVLKQLYEEEWRKDGHACPSYGEWKLNEEKKQKEIDNETFKKALDSIGKIPIKRPPIFTPIKPPKTPKPPKSPIKQKMPVKTIVAIAVLIIIGYFIYQNLETFSGTIFKLSPSSKPVCNFTFVKAYESSASFGRDPLAYCKDTCSEKYNSTDYKVIEPNQTYKMTACYCYVKNCGNQESIRILNKPPTCGDGTLYNQCSKNKPLYCLNGALTKNVSGCGCPTDEIPQGDSCISRFEIGPKNQTLNYLLRGSASAINFTVYAGLSNYLASLPRAYYCNPACPSNNELELRFLNQSKQKEYLVALVDQIKSKVNVKDDQLRIAVSLVQKIPYDYAGARSNNLYNKYPYEVVYEKTGVCGEKARLLAFILRELGYGVVLFDYEAQRHMAVGVKCPSKYAYSNTGYCFIETASPTIITDYESDYVGVGKLSTPEVLNVSDGLSFDSVSEEYNDAIQLRGLYILSESSGGFLDPGNYYTWQSLVNKYGIITLP